VTLPSDTFVDSKTINILIKTRIAAKLKPKL